MRRYALAFTVSLVAGCGGNGTTTVTPSSTPPADNGGGGGAGNGGGSPGGGGGGVDGGMPGGGGSGGMGGGGGSGGSGGGGDMGGGGGGGGGSGGSACTYAQPVAIASAEGFASAIAVDDSDVYFMAQATLTAPEDLWRAPLAGGAAVEIGSTGDPADGYMTVNATAIFTLNGDGQLLRWAKSGGAPLTLEAPGPNVEKTCLADAYGFIYHCTFEPHRWVQIFRQPEDGGGTTELVAQNYGIGNLAFDTEHVWFTTNSTHGVLGVPPDGKSGTTISIAANGAVGPIAVDDAHVFVGFNQQIFSADKRDGATLASITASPYPGMLVTDGGNVYARGAVIDSAGTHGTITRYAADGSHATQLAQGAGPGEIGGMAVRSDSVYYTLGNSVYRVCK